MTMTKSFKIFWDLQCPYSKKMWEQYRGYNNKKQHHQNSVAVLEHVLGVGNNNSQQQQQQQLHRLVNSISTSSTDNTGTGTPLLEPVAVPVPVDDAKYYVPRTIIHRDYTNVGHAAPHQELFTVYITSYAHHPQAFAAHCGASLIDTMKGRDVMFKFFENEDQKISSILGSTSPSSTCSVIAKQQNLQEQLVAA